VATEIVNPLSDTAGTDGTDGPDDAGSAGGADHTDGDFPLDPVFALHRGGKMEITSTVPVRDADDLSLAYTPGVAEVCTAIAAKPELVHDYTWKSQVVAVVTDGTAVLGLGDIGPEASLPARSRWPAPTSTRSWRPWSGSRRPSVG
jgi:malate dehydrogenase (oxaloacetate-decarboxylating)